MGTAELTPFAGLVKRVLYTDKQSEGWHNEHSMVRLRSSASGRWWLRRPKAKPYRRPGRRCAVPRQLVCLSSEEWTCLRKVLDEQAVPAELVEVLTCPEVDTPPENHGKIHPPWYRG